jgi:pimeloyl-ACP methyl ester carboxylesterase
MKSVSRRSLMFLGPALLSQPGGAARAEPPGADVLAVKGVRIRCFVQGSGSPVLLIHGWHSSAQLNWIAPGTMAALARTHRVIALDLPGYGGSDKPDMADAYGEQWVEDVVQVLEHVGAAKAHVVGYSLGGLIALKFIVDHPDRVLSGTLGGMGYMRQGGALQRVWAGMRDVSARSVRELALTPERVRSVRAPVEIVVGSNDPVRKLYVDPLLAIRTDWPVVEIDDADHITCIFKRQFRDELTRWLDRDR